ncbi:hypothetical protein LIER_02235 [Lithospermum erythrorhizon]|uniref:Uncharacterized protein n=1 Tax=Lithospermum erythrorhizon TaxID=34254 RepID=A0AAV3NR65_LITER
MQSVPQQPVAEMSPVVSAISFAMWGIDLVGQLLKPPMKYKDAVVAIDYFSKWVEAVPLRSTTAEAIEEFIWKNIITRVIGPGTYELEELSGKAIDHTLHEVYLKKYYA